MSSFPGPSPPRLRVITLNVWGRAGDWPSRRRVLADTFLELAPDIVALQESIVTDGYSQAADLLGDDFAMLEQRSRLTPEGLGVTLASRWPVLRSEEIDLHITDRGDEFPCVALLAEIDAPEPFGPLVMVNHFPYWQTDWENERCVQAVAVARAIERFAAAGQTVVVLGDLDAEPDAASIRFWTGHQPLDGWSVCYVDAWAAAHPNAGLRDGATHSPENPLTQRPWPFGRIDYVLVRAVGHRGPAVSIDLCERILDRPIAGVRGSDHFGLVADLGPS